MDVKTLLKTVLGSIDYTSGACRPNDMVGAALPKNILEMCKEAVKKEEAADALFNWKFMAFSEANRRRCESPDGFNHKLADWSDSDWMTAIVGEVGEAANIVKKLNRHRDGIPGNKQSKEQLAEALQREIADIFVYLDLFCQARGFYLIDVVIDVFNAKSREIGYPEILPE